MYHRLNGWNELFHSLPFWGIPNETVYNYSFMNESLPLFLTLLRTWRKGNGIFFPFPCNCLKQANLTAKQDSQRMQQPSSLMDKANICHHFNEVLKWRSQQLLKSWKEPPVGHPVPPSALWQDSFHSPLNAIQKCQQPLQILVSLCFDEFHPSGFYKRGLNHRATVILPTLGFSI